MWISDGEIFVWSVNVKRTGWLLRAAIKRVQCRHEGRTQQNFLKWLQVPEVFGKCPKTAWKWRICESLCINPLKSGIP